MKYLYFILVMALCSGVVWADVDDLKVRYRATYSLLEIDDPDGPTDSYSGFQPGSLGLIYNVNRRQRIACDFSWIDFEVEASTSNISNTVSGYMVTSSFQWLFHLSRKIDLWAGAGVIASKINYDSRYTVTDSGYLLESYEDREESSFGLCVQASNEWELTDRIDLSIDIEYQHLFGDSLNGVICGISFYYKFGGR